MITDEEAREHHRAEIERLDEVIDKQAVEIQRLNALVTELYKTITNQPVHSGIAALTRENRELRAEVERLTVAIGDPRANTPANAYWRKRMQIMATEQRLQPTSRSNADLILGSDPLEDKMRGEK